MLGAVARASGEFHHVEDEDGQRDNDGLPHLHSVNTGKNVDGIGAEHSQHPHVHIIEHT